MKITVLGCGSSAGVPALGFGWGKCDPSNPKNRRSRPSILMQEKNTNLLVDAGPDIRHQLLPLQLKHLDGLFLTHFHADHIGGIDDLRPFNNLSHEPLETYANAPCWEILRQRLPHVFQLPSSKKFFPHACLQPHTVKTGNRITIGDISLIPFDQDHGFGVVSCGFRHDNFAYSIDVHRLDETALEILHGIDIWIVDCLRIEPPHPTHAHLAQVIEWNERVGASRIFLSHMSQDYDMLNRHSPSYITPCHDGLVITT